ncbi:MAG TPA: nuclear transport factor 2 family protein [Pyrinomonadaceae bacterium]|nr:nuclear transport factor 2 family protein [Pyrinomonadaceae bacterium]
MLKRFFLIAALVIASSSLSFAQQENANVTTTRRRTTTRATPAKQVGQNSNAQQTEQAAQTQTRRASTNQNAAAGAGDPTSRGVLAAFNALLEGIRHSDVNKVANAYWNSPQLVLFNNNGSVTRGWETMRANRASSYPNMRDVKLDVRDLRVTMLGRDGALVTCLWTQSQTANGQSETASGRMTLVFKRIGNSWKAVHLHTSPDAPSPSRVLPSERPTQPGTP